MGTLLQGLTAYELESKADVLKSLTDAPVLPTSEHCITVSPRHWHDGWRGQQMKQLRVASMRRRICREL